MNKKILMLAPAFYGIDESIQQALESLGYDVILHNSRDRLNLVENISLRAIKKIPLTKNILNQNLKFFLKQDNKEYVSLTRKIRPDMLFIIKGETVFPETLKTIREEMKIPLVAYIWDCPFYSYAGRYADDYRRTNFAKSMALYDHIFVYDPYYVEEIKKCGITNVNYLPLATDTSKYKKIDPTPCEADEYGYDVCFVGRPFANRVEVLDSLGEFKLGVFGEGWARYYGRARPPSYYKGKAVGEKVLKIYAASKIVLNIHDPEATRGVNTRTFDIAACGAFELVDYKSELETLFDIGKEIVYYKDIAGLRKIIRFYIDRPNERKAIAERGLSKVLACHTWRHRMSEMMRVVKNKGLL